MSQYMAVADFVDPSIYEHLGCFHSFCCSVAIGTRFDEIIQSQNQHNNKRHGYLLFVRCI